MKVNFHQGTTVIQSAAGNFTPEASMLDKKAWDGAIAWLSAKSARFKTMYDEILAYSHVPNAYVVACEDGPFTQGKFFTPEETAGWPGELDGKPAIVMTLRGCVTISYQNTQKLKYLGEANSDLFGNTRWADAEVAPAPLPNGWTCTAGKPAMRKLAVQSPLIAVAHELGHMWQWARFRNGYTAISDRAVRSGQAMGNDFLRIEINNIVNNESVIALEMGEGVRFTYDYPGETFKSDFLYSLPELSGTLALVPHNDTRKADWPTRSDTRVYGQSQLGDTLTFAGAKVMELTPDFPCKAVD